jgi:hypothetical protein
MIASFTYGPLLGLFAFGIFTKKIISDQYVWIISIIAPLICYLLSENSVAWFAGYKFGYELLLLNGMLTFLGLWMITKKSNKSTIA